jgi:hypothetical protein
MRCSRSISLAYQLTCMQVCEGNLSFHVSCLEHICIRIVVQCQLVVSFFTICLCFSYLLQWLCYNVSAATMALLQWLCYNDAIISCLQGVPAKHLRLAQLLRIRLRPVMLRYRVARFSESALILVVFGRWYPLASLVSSDSFPLLCLFSLTNYLSIYLSIYLHNNEQQTSGTNIFSYHK